MAASVLSPATTRTVADLLKQLGDVPAERVRLWPTLGTATETDLLEVLEQEGIACELIDGALVEKPMGALEAYLALRLGTAINNFLDRHDLGFTTGADGPLRLLPGLVRLPDVSFVSWGQLPAREVPSTPVPSLYPDLAVEVLSGSNTPAEMLRKRAEYFRAGTQLVWEIDPDARTVDVYTTPPTPTRLTEADTLDGGAVLPGFSLPLAQLFARAGRP